MECENCKNFYITKYYLKNYFDKIIVSLFCDKCKLNTDFIIKKKHNYMIRNKPPPLHLPKYNYCGPFTDVLNSIDMNIHPYNDLDKQCLFHDLSYHIFKNKDRRKKADYNLIKYIKDNNKKSINSKIILYILTFKTVFS